MIIYRNKSIWLKQNCQGSDTPYLFLRFSVYEQGMGSALDTRPQSTVHGKQLMAS